MSALPFPSHSAPTVPPLSHAIGQVERALRALLDRQLAPAGLSFPEWTILVVLESAGPLAPAVLIQRQLDGHIVPTAAAAQATIDALLARSLLGPGDAPGVPETAATPIGAELGRAPRSLARTPAGDVVYRSVRAAVAGITQALYNDLPASDLEATGRTLGELARRARGLLAAGGPAAPGYSTA